MATPRSLVAPARTVADIERAVELCHFHRLLPEVIPDGVPQEYPPLEREDLAQVLHHLRAAP